MDYMNLDNIPDSTIDILLDEIEENEKQISSSNTIDLWIRNRWNIASFVEIYSKSHHLWFKGQIVSILHDEQGEWLVIKYVDSKNKQIRAQTARSDINNIRPFSKAMEIYKYIYNSTKGKYIEYPHDSPEKTPLVYDLDDLSADDLNDNDNDSDTPEPFDTSQLIQPPNGHGSGYSINVHYNSQEMKLSDSDNDVDVDDDDVPSLSLSISGSRSVGYWELKTMTRMKRSSSKIKCITPISQYVAEMKIKNYYRRRSVANIDHTVHRMFKLDADLLKIREDYAEKMESNDDNRMDEM